MLKEKKRLGEEPVVSHKQPLSDSDLEKLDSYFSDVLTVPDPRKLSFFVWYTVTTHFCLRGGELQAKLQKSDVIFTTVDDNEKIRLATDFMTKNHRGGVDGTSFPTSGCITDDLQVRATKVPQRSSSEV